jgi:uncharacterized protein YjbI with pentapeptide repeats
LAGLIEEQEFNRASGPPSEWRETIFRFCTFADLAIEGHGLEGALLWCTLRNVDWYWGLFNVAIIIRTTFEGCVFRGSSFRGCQFVECKFDQCRFELDNLEAECTFDYCTIVECTFDRCKFVLGSPSGRSVFTKTRWYGCTQARCKGLEGLF